MKRLLLKLTVLLTAVSLTGCAATTTAISKRNLDVQTKMTDSVFMDPAAPQDMRILVQIRNTSDKPNFTIQQQIESALVQRGYTIVRDPNQAVFMLQANILQVGMTDPTAAEQMYASGYGGGLEGVAIGATTAYALGANRGADIAAAGLIAGAASLVANSLVKDVYYSVITDLQISRRTEGTVRMRGNQNLQQGTSGAEQLTYERETNWIRYRTRIMSSANKVNLKWEEAEPDLIAGLTQSISGMF